ncbi:MAG: hypothetical protein DWQ47_09855 [Acidobacteria bacterium]|nr:MAG: hypothetical protein DWQ32_12270 [Acidobacteriota bacterium]REJ98706.1 MAG: hypothetical protein DWQ38_15210 [Acidobacteriota bacterium]REK16639.1 MAG: hypothetical protein DWQ43_00115 [Acidobacteriota bacterium]REK42550.1 MAG: hypothetical protein DWQ47_09855 [Acidobacteriota bacterium]
MNLLTAEHCHRCGKLLSDLPQTAQVSVPVEQTFQAQQAQMSSRPPAGRISQDNETGRKTFMWYRVYCGVLLFLYIFVAFMGILLLSGFGAESQQDEMEMMITGAVYGVIGFVFAVAYGIALFLPRKPYNWVVGIVMIAIGLTSCCFLPATVPLLIFWLKPETKAYFGRES